MAAPIRTPIRHALRTNTNNGLRNTPVSHSTPTPRRLLFPPPNDHSQTSVGTLDHEFQTQPQYSQQQSQPHSQHSEQQSQQQSQQQTPQQQVPQLYSPVPFGTSQQQQQLQMPQHLPASQVQMQFGALAQQYGTALQPPTPTPQASGQYHELEESKENVETDYLIKAPEGLELQEVQYAIDKALYEKSKTKRRYDSNRLDDEFKDGGKFFNDLISKARMIFARYFCILDEWIPRMINDAAGRLVDISSNGYLKSYNRILAWRKNWFSDFFIDVDALQRRIQDDNMGLLGTTRAVIDWGETLRNPHMLALYKTIFTYSLVYSHRAHHDPGSFTRGEAFDRVRTIGLAEEYSPMGKVRYRKSKKRNLEKDDLFVPFAPPESAASSAAAPGPAAAPAAASTPIHVDLDPTPPSVSSPLFIDENDNEIFLSYITYHT
ncbi:hypothetical protein DFP73DRAFT_530067 [Morchella snyderi]|nr:hypothetical protein DFP73DRAFT_530067 [Morchella snyderi]